MSEDIFKIHCNKCGAETIHNTFIAHSEKKTIHQYIDYMNMTFTEWTTATVYRCGGCGEFVFKKYRIWSEDAPNFKELDVVILPQRNIPILKTPAQFRHVPENIVSLYKEIIEAVVNEMIILCSAGIRAIIEAICIDKEIEGGIVSGLYNAFLAGKIMGLCGNGYLTQKHAESLLHHKFMGDKAIHELRTVTKEDLVAAIDIIAHTLDSVYELEAKVKSWNDAHERKKK